MRDDIRQNILDALLREETISKTFLADVLLHLEDAINGIGGFSDKCGERLDKLEAFVYSTGDRPEDPQGLSAVLAHQVNVMMHQVQGMVELKKEIADIGNSYRHVKTMLGVIMKNQAELMNKLNQIQTTNPKG